MERFLSARWKSVLAMLVLVVGFWGWPTPYINLGFRKHHGTDCFFRQSRMTGGIQYFHPVSGKWEKWGPTQDGRQEDSKNEKTQKITGLLARAEKGDVRAQTWLAHTYRGDYGDPKNLEESLRWFKAAAEQGDTVGENGYGWALEHGLAVEPNPKEAVAWYRRAAAKNDRWALDRLGRCYLDGVGVDANPREAQEYFEKATRAKTGQGDKKDGQLAVAKNSRNPFSVPDIPDFDIEKIRAFAKDISLPGGSQDPNAASWLKGMEASDEKISQESLAGDWHGRWNGGSAAANWVQGKAEVREKDGRIYFLFRDNTGVYLLEAQKDGNRLLGRHIEVRSGRDEGPWVGRLVNSRRIDGQWAHGRWDFRR